jgi:phospholipid/cholesterol/gamma-HCH transport system substrate-binding protein
VTVGFTILLAGVVLIVGILAVGKESRLFTRKVAYWTAFPNVSGLSEGSPVQLVGVRVGTVSRVDFSPDLGDRQIRVTILVERSYADRIREGTQALLKSLSYVSQERYIELTPGDPDRPILRPGSRIEPGLSGLAELTEMGRGIADDVKDITAQLRELLMSLNKGGGILPEMIRNPDFGKESLQGVQDTVTSIQRITGRIEKGEGLAGQLLMNKEYAARQMASLESSLDRLRTVLEKLESGHGAAGELLAEGGKGEKLLDSLLATTSDLKEVTTQIKAGNGLAGRLVQDDAAAKAILSNLQKTTAHLESITAKIDRGEGSVGALINDPEVYEGLRDVVGGIRKSRMGKGVIRHYQKKVNRERTEENPPPAENP